MIIVVPERLTLESVIQNVNLDKNETTIPIGFNINDLNYIDIADAMQSADEDIASKISMQ